MPNIVASIYAVRAMKSQSTISNITLCGAKSSPYVFECCVKNETILTILAHSILTKFNIR